MHRKLYKRTSTGSIQVWWMESEGNAYRTHSGKLDGKIVTSGWTYTKGKNIGKVNETTPEQQALLEVEATYTKNLKRHYFENPDDVDNLKSFKPMLAKKYEDYPPNDFDETYSQPKLDGVRCIITEKGMFSRNGEPIISAPHIFNSIKGILDSHPETVILDGEIYCHRLHDNFNKIISLAKKTKPTSDDLKESADWLEFYLYDVFVPDKNFVDRFVDSYLVKTLAAAPFIVKVPTTKITDQNHLNELFASYMADGFEGQMIRFAQSKYENKRSKSLLKRKEFKDEEFEIVRLEEGQGNWAGYVKRVVCRTKDGIEFETGIKGNQNYLAKLLIEKDKYVGSDATVRFQDYTPDGKPRFGVTYTIWNGKRNM